MDKECQPCVEIRITRIGEKSLKVLQNIAAHQGCTTNQLVAPLLSSIAASFPDHIKSETECEPCGELKIPNVRAAVKRDLEAVAKYYGIPFGTFMKSLINDIIERFPAHMHREFNT